MTLGARHFRAGITRLLLAGLWPSAAGAQAATVPLSPEATTRGTTRVGVVAASRKSRAISPSSSTRTCTQRLRGISATALAPSPW